MPFRRKLGLKVVGSATVSELGMGEKLDNQFLVALL